MYRFRCSRSDVTVDGAGGGGDDGPGSTPTGATWHCFVSISTKALDRGDDVECPSHCHHARAPFVILQKGC